MSTAIQEAIAPAEDKPVSEWLQKKIEAREAAAAAGIPTPPRGRRKRAAPAPPATPRKRSTTPRAKAKKTDYTEGLIGLGQLVSFPLAFVAPADAAAITGHMPPIAKALNDLAQDKPEVAAVLDRVLAGGPYAALLTACAPLVVQLAHNHGLVPETVARTMGATPKRTILAQLREQAAQAAQAAQEDAQADAQARADHEAYRAAA